MTLDKDGFKSIVKSGIELHIQDVASINFELQVGSVSETVTVESGAPVVDTQNAAVKTVIDRQFVKEIPLNGRSFQTLFQLTPGVVVTQTSNAERGQFSVNGQRANANYFQVDGVSANVGAAAGGSPGQTVGGSQPALTAGGGTNALVSVDALQEFVIQTSTYSPEFGRTPGAQVEISTRSGSNEFHGDLFEYLRNDLFDANDWFANSLDLKKAALRQNDFGGVVGGPIVRNRTFFFFSYEGLRLRLPTTGLTEVPSEAARQSAPASIQPFLNAFPKPTGADEGNGLAPGNYAFSDPSGVDAVSVRVDHHFSSKISVFGRYSHTNSSQDQRGAGANSLATIESVPQGLQTVTVGLTANIRPTLLNDLRFNWSRSTAASVFTNDTLGGAVPLSLASILPAGEDPNSSAFRLNILSGNNAALAYGRNASNLQRQVNIVDNLIWQAGKHLVKTGIDYRRLMPQVGGAFYSQGTFFNDVPSLLQGSPAFGLLVASDSPVNATYLNYSVYGQDTWRAGSRLTLTYGVRWDYNPAPTGHGASGEQPFALRGFDNLANLTIAPPGTAVYHATKDNFAPRLGGNYQLFAHSGFEAVIRGGFGVFYDLGNGASGNIFASAPFQNIQFTSPSSFPLSGTDAARPPIPATPPFNSVVGFVSTLRQPYTYHWNLSFEQSLGANQAITASYIGAAGHSLVRQDNIQGGPLPPEFQQVLFTNNLGYSKYDALELQFRRRQSKGLEILGSYTYSHSLDNVSADSTQNPPSVQIDPRTDYGNSSFDIRHSGSVAIDYQPSLHMSSRWKRAVLGGWGFNTFIVARTAPPVNPEVLRNAGFGTTFYRPDLVAGVPLYLHDTTAPGGMRINPAAFTVSSAPRQGTLGRDALRGFPLFQQDVSIRRSFTLHENVRLQARLEAFNVLNHPNFAPPNSTLGFFTGKTLIPLGPFGVSQAMFGAGASGGGLGAGFNPLYQIGGPRSLQLALKLEF
ncbi:MAG TPA: TonB-dependent receptor [Candidatus Acidoferrum sp.]|nr:TonB-dependent receptor [Candidatus Acidoferrum sp.]